MVARTKKSQGRRGRRAAEEADTAVGQRYTFVVGERLGSGGMAEVFRGRTVDGTVEAAIKRPLASLRQADQDIFLREAEAAAKAAGPGVVRVIDWGSPPFIAFELVSDPTLEAEIERRQSARDPWPIATQVSLFRQLAAAMKIVNEQVLHRDIKPANIFVGACSVRVSDFGLAKFADEATRSRTFKHWGTTAYIAPEAWQGRATVSSSHRLR